MQIRSSSYYAHAVPVGHPVIAAARDLGKQIDTYDALTVAQQRTPKGKALAGLIGTLSKKCDVMLFALFPELKALDMAYDSMSPANQEAFQEFAFDLWAELTAREA